MPLQLCITGALSAVLELREMTLEESDLMLVGCGWCVVGRRLDREMVIDFALVDGSGGLRNELSPQHGLTIPFRCLINGDLDTLLRASIGGVLVRRIEVDIFVDSA